MVTRFLTLLTVLSLLLSGTGVFGQDNAPAVNIDKTRVYVLGPSDVINVKIYQEDDLDTTARVAKDGSITMPLVGAINIGGKTVEQAAAYIRSLYGKDYLVNPQVRVYVAEYAKRRFTVLGHVQRPGSYEIPSEETITLTQAIAMAGGYTRIGNGRKVTVQRVVDGQQKSFKLDAEAMTNNQKQKPFEILPEDTVTIGEKWI